MCAGEAQVIIRSISSNVLITIFIELGHEAFEVILASSTSHMRRGEICMHTGTIPVTGKWFAVPINVNTIGFTDTQKDVTGNVHLVGRVLGTLAKNLKLPLSLGDLGIDAFMVNSGSKADVKVLFNNRASNVANILETNTGVIFTLWVRETSFRPSQGTPILI